MRIIYLLLGASLFSTLLLWAGAFNFIKRKLAIALAFAALLAVGGMLLLAVLPGNSFYGPVITQVNTEKKLIALTFDDGPYPPYTEKLLQVLEEKQVKATFFLVGENVKRHPELARKVKAAGHEIALHAGVHQDLLKLNSEALQANIALGKTILKEELGVEPRFMRPPHGFKDWQVIAAIKANGLQAMNWSIIPRDWTNPGVETITSRVLDKAQPGAIVLLHDGDSPKNLAPRQQTVEATAIIIDKLRHQGYEFVSASQLLQAGK